MENDYYMACMDVGGTSVKTAVVGKDGSIADGSYRLIKIKSQGPAETILASFTNALKNVMDYSREKKLLLAGIGISICGPFDFEEGVSRIKGLGKYESIYGVNIRKTLQKKLDLPENLPVFFNADSWSFSIGEACFGAGRVYSRIIAFTMGTGVGSSFVVNGKVVTKGPGVPWLGWISGQKFKDGILNDYLSRPFMISQYKKLTGAEIEIDEMASRAFRGDDDAKNVFIEVGTVLGNFLKKHHVEEFGAQCLIFGGRISRSYDLFIDPIKEKLDSIPCIKAILPADDIEHGALKGIAKHVFDNVNNL